MSPSDVISILGPSISGTVAIVMLALFITGQIVPKSRVDEIKEERDEWRQVAENERLRADAGVQAGQIVRDVLTTLHRELGQ